MDAQPILKKTLVTIAVMVGAWVAFVGTVSLVAVLVTSHIVGSTGESASPNDANETVTPGKRLPGAGPSRLNNPGQISKAPPLTPRPTAPRTRQSEKPDETSAYLA